MKRKYRIFIIWLHGKMWLAKTMKYKIEREQWKKIVDEWHRARIAELSNKKNLVVSNYITNQIRVGGQAIDFTFFEDMF